MATITVTSNADQGSGSLREAISIAKDGDTIQFAKNLAKKTITLTEGQLVLDKSITLDGQNAPNLTISGNRSSRVFQIEKNTDVFIKDLRIAEGKVDGEGGGIRARQGSSLTLVNTQIENNVSELGGGLRLGHLAKATIIDSEFKGNDGTLTANKAGFSAGAISTDSRAELIIRGTKFIENQGFNGGAIYAYSTTKFEIEDAIFEGNTAKNKAGGGAIFTDGINPFGPQDLSAGGILRISNSRFERNQTDGGGGALFLFGYGQDKTIVKDSVFIGNTANENGNGIARGGAIQSNMELAIQNSTFSDNTSEKQGGALWLNSKRPVEIINSTFSGNEVIGDAGGAMFLNTKSTPVDIINSTIVNNSAGRANGALWYSKNHAVTLTNSIVAFNIAKQDSRQNQVGFQAFDGGGNLEFSQDKRSMRVLSGSLVADPKLTPLKNVDGMLVHALQTDSPAIDAGIRAGAPNTDQRGFQRDSQLDIGAFERNTSLGNSSNNTSQAPTPTSSPSPSIPVTSNIPGDSPMNNSTTDLALDFDRIAVSADGNADPDDIGATPAGLAMLAHAGLQDSLVHYHVNSQVWQKATQARNAKMRDSAYGSASRMGFDQELFFDALIEYQADGPDNAATQHLAQAINASSANDRLLIVGAGPMEVIYQAVKLADPEKLEYVEVLTHSHVNDKNTGDGSGHTRTDIEALGVDFIDIRDQNRGFSTKKDFGLWSWMKNHPNQDLQWVYERMQAGGKADISDAGMIYYALTGEPEGDISDLQDFFGSTPAPSPEPIPSPEPTPSPNPNPIPPQGEAALFVVDAGKSLKGSSTFRSDSFQITNNSEAGQKISRLLIDTRTAMFPDLVFDPYGDAGDAKSRDFTVDQDPGVGLQSHQFLSEHDGGFDLLEIKFDDFDPGETFTFSLDMDPTSTKGTTSKGSNHAGSVSGLELVGTTVTVEFEGGASFARQTYRRLDSATGSQANLSKTVLSRPEIEVLGLSDRQATVSDADQTVRIKGPANSMVSLLVVEGAFLTDENGMAFDPDPFEANTALAFEETVANIGSQGYVDVGITLTKMDADGGLNYLVAVVKDDNGNTSLTSPTQILELTTDNAPPTPTPSPSPLPIPPAPSPAPVPVPVPDITDIEGTENDDILKGTNKGEIIRALQGKDIIDSKGGNDFVYGGLGDDEIDGGRGNDNLAGNEGNDYLEAGRHNDILYGNEGDDLLVGVKAKSGKPGQGEMDVLVGGDGADIFILGDRSKVYYVDSDVNSGGEEDYALIKDFNLSQGDIIRLSGEISDYTISGVTGGVGIYSTQFGVDEMIAVVETDNISELNNSAFQFV